MSRVVHFEIHAGDPERAVEFYREIFGWEFSKWEGPQDYWLIKTGPDDEPGIDCGLLRRQGEIDGQAVIAYVCTVDVPSVDDVLQKVTRIGGQVAVPKMAVPGIGWLAYCKDTEGNLFGAMQADPQAA
jgi:predicted enzyme related to lactoylglutathione lyase